jgi:hypothetical protein
LNKIDENKNKNGNERNERKGGNKIIIDDMNIFRFKNKNDKIPLTLALQKLRCHSKKLLQILSDNFNDDILTILDSSDLTPLHYYVKFIENDISPSIIKALTDSKESCLTTYGGKFKSSPLITYLTTLNANSFLELLYEKTSHFTIKNVNCIKQLIDKDQKVLIGQDSAGNTPLHFFLSIIQNFKQDHVTRSIIDLLTIEENLSIPNKKGYYPLHLAVKYIRNIDIKTIQKFITSVQPDFILQKKTFEKNKTALHLYLKHQFVITLTHVNLLSKLTTTTISSQNPNEEDGKKEEKEEEDESIILSPDYMGRYPLTYLIIYQSEFVEKSFFNPIVNCLIDKNKTLLSNVKNTVYGLEVMSPLTLALYSIEYIPLSLVKILSDNGNQQILQYHTAFVDKPLEILFIYQSQSYHINVMDYLMRHNYKYSSTYLTDQNNSGKSTLLGIVSEFNIQLSKMPKLVDKLIDKPEKKVVNLIDHEGDTPFTMALNFHYFENNSAKPNNYKNYRDFIQLLYKLVPTSQETLLTQTIQERLSMTHLHSYLKWYNTHFIEQPPPIEHVPQNQQSCANTRIPTLKNIDYKLVKLLIDKDQKVLELKNSLNQTPLEYINDIVSKCPTLSSNSNNRKLRIFQLLKN